MRPLPLLLAAALLLGPTPTPGATVDAEFDSIRGTPVADLFAKD